MEQGKTNAREGGKRILVVDDVKLFRDLVHVVLGGTGYQVISAESGREALEVARRERPDLVLLDLYMPEMDGEATCRALRAEPALTDVPVIMVTSGADAREVTRCVEAGCDDYVLKPIRRGPLVRKITGLVDERAFERVRVPVDVPVAFEPARGAGSRAGRAVNISAGGLFVETPEPADPGSDLALAFALPVPEFEQSLTAMGRVAWVNGERDRRKRDFGPGMGIAFRDLSDAGRSLIARFVRIRRRAALVA